MATKDVALAKELGINESELNGEFDIEEMEDGVDIEEFPAPKNAGKKPAKAAKKVKIMIDEVQGMSNYEVIGCNGDVIKIKRGVVVEVDPKYVHVLELAQQTVTEQRLNRMTGDVEEVSKTYSAIPWREVR